MLQIADCIVGCAGEFIEFTLDHELLPELAPESHFSNANFRKIAPVLRGVSLTISVGIRS